MIIELRSLLPAREEEESSHDPEEKHEVKEGPFAEVELRSAGLPRTSPIPESVPFPEPSPMPGFFPAAASDAAGAASGDDRIPELLERLIDTAERSAALSERIADLMERQSSVSAPVYA